jgi:hypothetical protein
VRVRQLAISSAAVIALSLSAAPAHAAAGTLACVPGPSPKLMQCYHNLSGTCRARADALARELQANLRPGQRPSDEMVHRIRHLIAECCPQATHPG